MEIGGLLTKYRDEVVRVAARYGAYNIRVFGSQVQGTADEQSDIDFLVDLEPGKSLLDLGGLQYELEHLLQHRVDVVTERGLKSRIRERVLHEAVSL